MTELVLTSTVSPAVSIATLNRPDRRNALSIALLKQLTETIRQLEKDSHTRVLILQGAGGFFSSGLELTEAADLSHTAESATTAARAMRAVRQSPLVVVASVSGGAYAGGAALMASCDIVIAEQTAKVSFPAARRGLLPSLIFDLVQSQVCDGDLRDLFLTGLPVDAKTAQRMGLIQRVVPTEDLPEESRTVARAVAEGAPETIRQTKAMIRESADSDLSDAAFEQSIAGHLAGQNTDEAQEGMRSFLEKRQPWWVEEQGRKVDR